MKFERLRLSGFKSFVEPTELLIQPGLTAIVGPNGCGKSNLFDALRWVMGEHRATSIRGTEMDDVIFAGSSNRPARNMAEVMLTVDNSDRSANPPYNESDTIEISRRIEREAGSVYRINGRDVRQRDVQLFFADASSGASSTAFVRQGMIGQLVSQKPQARRAVLEEAAGISGLHQRRHEAEIRLKAAETNLGRLTDVIGEVESQVQSLKRQARLASRYRNLSGHIRKAEALAFHLRWTAAKLRTEKAREAMAAAMAVVESTTATAAIASATQAETAEILPPLRETEAEKNAILHRLVLQREALDAEEKRAQELAQSLNQRLAQTSQDRDRENALVKDAETALGHLNAEETELKTAQEQSGTELVAAESRATELNETLNEAERLLEKLTSELAEHNAREGSLLRARRQSADLAEASGRQLSQAQSRLDTAAAEASGAPDVKTTEEAVAEARRVAEQATAAVAQARQHLQEAEKTEQALRAPVENAEREVNKLSAEAKALSDFLRSGAGAGKWPPLVDAVTVEPGMEAALASALGDDLEAPLDEAAPHHWRNLGDYDGLSPLPEGAVALSGFVQAPEALTRRLTMTGVIEPEQGAEMQKLLKAGQRLVSKRGDLWRWDGFRASADAPSAEAVRLAQRNRLAALQGQIETAKQAKDEAAATYTAAREATVTARTAARDAEQNERNLQRSIMAAQDLATKAARAAAERASKLAFWEAEIRRITETRDRALEAEKQAAQGLAELGNNAALVQQNADARQTATEARSASSNARAQLEGLKRDQETRARRLLAIANEKTRWEERRTAAAAQIVEMDRRVGELQTELTTAEAQPAAIAEKRGALVEAIATADSARKEAADKRATAEATLTDADKRAKAAESAASSAREERARAEALVEAETARLVELETRIRDELEIEPEGLPERAEIKDSSELPPQDQAEKKVEKLKAEREQLGGVNLRAEEEATEAENRLNTLIADRDDLTQAIEKLRRGIQSLNREGRERLSEAFDKVNENFQSLFAKLFQGGEAKLTFTESDDPLQAGLEIYARPPGKRLQSLSLLSGGEQALTALALIFAVFLVNPAPVCVLDEVDAPLDDANVERYCAIMDEMNRLTQTRFLVITHHALTMSRMHRLFGVTMSERGVSQLVSVSLTEAERVAAE
ncbi:MAG: AAA family ATPase [Rhizomicrobium sp.]